MKYENKIFKKIAAFVGKHCYHSLLDLKFAEDSERTVVSPQSIAKKKKKFFLNEDEMGKWMDKVEKNMDYEIKCLLFLKSPDCKNCVLSPQRHWEYHFTSSLL